jgi:hypothetical protein
MASPGLDSVGSRVLDAVWSGRVFPVRSTVLALFPFSPQLRPSVWTDGRHFPCVVIFYQNVTSLFQVLRHFRLYNINSLLERKIKNVQNKPNVFQVRSRVERETQILLEWPTSRFEY